MVSHHVQAAVGAGVVVEDHGYSAEMVTSPGARMGWMLMLMSSVSDSAAMMPWEIRPGLCHK